MFRRVATCLVIPLLSICSFAQEKTTAQKATKPCATLAKCRAQVQSFSDDNLSLYAELGSKSAEIDQLKADKAALTEKNAELEKKLEDLRNAATEVLKFNAKLQEEYFKSIQQQNDNAEKYNNLLSAARQSIDAANERLARQYRVNNALMMYSLMPKVQPYVLPQPVAPALPIYQPPVRVQTNCTSSYVSGGTVVTNCN